MVKLHQPGTEPFEVPETVPNPVTQPRRERTEPPAPQPVRPKREPERKPEPVDAQLNDKGSRHVRDPLFCCRACFYIINVALLLRNKFWRVPMTMQTTSTIIRFYGGADTDNLGRKLEEMWEWTDDKLEGIHNYIQWMFPTDERSAFNSNAPVLTDDEAEVFLNSPHLQGRVRASLVRILAFYGFEMERTGRGNVLITPVDVNKKAAIWLTPHNHNFLRITRILKCLCLTGLKPEATAFLAALQLVYNSYADTIGEETLGYWQAAVK